MIDLHVIQIYSGIIRITIPWSSSLPNLWLSYTISVDFAAVVSFDLTTIVSADFAARQSAIASADFAVA